MHASCQPSLYGDGVTFLNCFLCIQNTSSALMITVKNFWVPTAHSYYQDQTTSTKNYCFSTTQMSFVILCTSATSIARKELSVSFCSCFDILSNLFLRPVYLLHPQTKDSFFSNLQVSECVVHKRFLFVS